MTMRFIKAALVISFLAGGFSTAAHAGMDAVPAVLDCGEVELGTSKVCGLVVWYWEPYSQGRAYFDRYQITEPVYLSINPYSQFELFDMNNCNAHTIINPGPSCSYWVKVAATTLGVHEARVRVEGGPRGSGQTPMGSRSMRITANVVEVGAGGPDEGGEAGEPGGSTGCVPDPDKSRYCVRLPL